MDKLAYNNMLRMLLCMKGQRGEWLNRCKGRNLSSNRQKYIVIDRKKNPPVINI